MAESEMVMMMVMVVFEAVAVAAFVAPRLERVKLRWPE